MKPPWLAAPVAIAVLAAPAGALAQPLFYHEESIECTVTNADAVAVGVVADIAAGLDSATGTIAVEETLKGEHHDRLRFRLPAYSPIVAGKKGPALRVLVAGRVDAADGGLLSEARAIDLSGRGPEVLTADLEVLKAPEDALRAARRAIRRMPGVRRIDTFRLQASAPAMAGTRWEEVHGKGVNLILEVPVDFRLEERAVRSIRSESSSDREEGARALRSFRSGTNVALAKALLADPAWAHGKRAEDNLGREERVYGVREAAYQTLSYWGVKVDEPVTREALYKPELVQTVSFSNMRATDADLDGLARFTNLEDLYLLNEPVTDARLGRLAGLRGVRSLDLGGTAVTDAGLKAIAGMAHLRHLSLRGTKVTGSGLRDLAGLKELESLDLTQTAVTDERIVDLASLTGLKKLDLGGAKVSADGIERLLKLRPDLKVSR